MSDPIKVRVVRRIAYLLPRSIVYWAGIRLMNWSAKDSGPPYAAPHKLTMYDALERWDDQ